MRSKNAAINSISAIIQKIVETILSFVYRTIFIQILGAVYLGVNGLFTNIFSIMSLAELGIGSSIIYLLYKPLSEKDYTKINQLMNFFAKMYKLIALIIAIIGILLIPILPYIVKNDNNIPNLNLIYVLLLANTVSSYLFSYKRSLLEADQKAYYSTINLSIFSIINTTFRIVVLVITKSFIFTLLVSIIVTLISNISISIKVNKMYPYLKNTSEKLEKTLLWEIKKRMKAIMMHKIGNIVITSTDNLIISMFISVVAVGIYSNYTMITNIIYTTFSMVFISFTASVGNLKIEEGNDKSENVFQKLLFLNFFFYYITCCCLISSFNELIYVWLGNDYLLSHVTVFFLILNLYISGMRHTVVTFINSSGLNYLTRYKPILESIVNLTTSLILVKYFGIVGVVIGTIACYLVGSVWIEPVTLYKNWFNKNSKLFFKKYIYYILLTFSTSFLIKVGLKWFVVDSWCLLFIKILIEFIIGITIFVLIFYRTENFKYFLNLFKNILRKTQKNTD